MIEDVPALAIEKAGIRISNERDRVQSSIAKQLKADTGNELQERIEVGLRNKSIDFNTQERLREFIAHQMKFFDLSGEEFKDVTNFKIINDGLVFLYDFVEKGGDIYEVSVKLIGPGKYDINGRRLTLDEIFELIRLEDKSDEDIEYKRDQILTFIVESILY